MRILINALSARLGGGQTYLVNLLAHLPDRRDLDIQIYAPVSLRLPIDNRITRCATSWPTDNPLLRALWEKFALPRILAEKEIQILFCPGGVIALDVPKGCKTVTMFRNMLPFDRVALGHLPIGLQRVRNLLLRRIMMRSMANADLTIFISDYARRTMKELIDIRNPVTISHGISAEFRTHAQNLSRPIWLPSGEYLLYVSRFEPYKHHFEVAEGFAAMPLEYRMRYKLLMIGEPDVKIVRRIAALARKKNLAGQILMIGAIAYSELPAAYHHASVNLFASSCENCPNILLEALGAGRPVLTSDIMPMPEFGAGAVEYFSPSDPLSIRDSLVRVLCDESRQLQLAASAARRSADFDWATASRMTWQHMLKLIPHENPCS